MTILIQNGHVIDPLTGRDEVCDVLVRDGKIQKIGTALSGEAEQVLDASGCYVMPGSFLAPILIICSVLP